MYLLFITAFQGAIEIVFPTQKAYKSHGKNSHIPTKPPCMYANNRRRLLPSKSSFDEKNHFCVFLTYFISYHVQMGSSLCSFLTVALLAALDATTEHKLCFKDTRT